MDAYGVGGWKSISSDNEAVSKIVCKLNKRQMVQPTKNPRDDSMILSRRYNSKEGANARALILQTLIKLDNKKMLPKNFKCLSNKTWKKL